MNARAILSFILFSHCVILYVLLQTVEIYIIQQPNCFLLLLFFLSPFVAYLGSTTLFAGERVAAVGVKPSALVKAEE